MLAGVLASALLFGLYAQVDIAWPLGFVALLPWLLALESSPGALATLRSGWLMSAAFVAAVFGWFGVAIGEFTGMGSVFGVAIMLVAAPLLQPQFLVFALVRRWAGARHGPALRTLAGASAWAATEWLVPRLLGDSIGHGLYPSAEYRQAADLGGVAGLGFVLIVINECLARIAMRRRDGLRPLIAPALSVVALLGLGWVYGTWRLVDAITESDDPHLRIGMVQSNLYDYERMRRQVGAYAVVRQVLDTHYALSREAIARGPVDALLWSETVYPTTFGRPKSEGGAELDREILDFVDTAGVPLVFGTYDVDAAGEYNAAAFVEPSAGLIGFYRKTHTFPLTEHVPAWLEGPALRRLLPWAGSWIPGNGARVFPLRLADGRQIPVLPLICLDDVDSGLAIDGARLGAQAILTMSNDSWFTRHPVGARLHLAVAAFRSIETRLPQFRVTANGHSAVIDAHGEVLASTSMGEQRVLAGSLPLRDRGPTLVTAWGDWVGRAGLVFLLLMAAHSLLAGRGLAKVDVGRVDAQDAADRLARGRMLPIGWRIATGLLELCTWAGLLWIGLAALSPSAAPVQGLAQMKLFAALVLAPQLAVWSIRRAFAGSFSREDARRIFEQASAYARARAMAPRWRLDHWAFKFLLFPLVPALPAFRLHQHIAYGGTFGEYYSFGLKAYLLALLIWWASWAIGLVLVATALRALAEPVALAAAMARPQLAFEVRVWVERAQRLMFYVGVPAWLLVRILYA
jgi:apolipoprotein N-acyltransferase